MLPSRRLFISRVLPLATAVCALFSVAALILGSATTLGGNNTGATGVGRSTITRCDTAVTVTYTTSGGTLNTATVGGLADPACEGAAVSIALLSSTNSTLATGGPTVVATDGDTIDNSVTINLSPTTVNPDNLSTYKVVINGP